MKQSGVGKLSVGNFDESSGKMLLTRYNGKISDTFAGQSSSAFAKTGFDAQVIINGSDHKSGRHSSLKLGNNSKFGSQVVI
jgi:hypothetical protein